MAIQLYLEAYSTIDQDPSLLYNVAFIYEQTKRFKAASDMYRKVALATRSTPELREMASDRRDRLPAVRAKVPLLKKTPAIIKPVPRPVKRPPPVVAPRVQPVRKTKPKAKPKPVAPVKAPVAAPTSPATEAKNPNRRLSPEQRRRLEMRLRRERAKKGR